MIPRIEQKAELSLSNYSIAINWLYKNKFNLIYPERIVSSIYFDNFKMESYIDTLEGNTPRRKLRIRSYGKNAFDNLANKYKLETKLSGEFYRSKSQKEIYDLETFLKNGIVDSQYGICFPSAKITYVREYYGYKNLRVTIDKSIEYENLKYKSRIFREENYVLEIKTSINENLTIIRNFFEFPRSKFSKYERAIQSF